MEKDSWKTDMVFRVDKHGDFKGTVFALFPHEISHGTLVTCYQHVGQHSSADYQSCVDRSRLATEEEYADLKAELECLGYNINVVKRQNYDKFLQAYHQQFKR
jgi:hypothetical protein